MHRARKSVLDRLRAPEARSVLTRLLSLYPDLISVAERVSLEVLSEIDHLSVATRVSHALSVITEGDEARRGAEIEAALGPFMDDIHRRLDQDLPDAALEICQGVILALYRLKDNASGPMGGAPTLAREAAQWAVERWSEHGARQVPRAFLKARAPEWAGLLT